MINKQLYEDIVKQTNISTSEKKIEFLFRYLPKIRKIGRKMLEEFEICFIKEEYSKGYQIQK
jgi:hypothetical protein